MKKIIAIMLAVVMAFALVTIVACNSEKVVRVTLFVTENETIVRNHTVGQNDLPTNFTNGDLEFGGWYYDKAFNEEFDPNREDNNQMVYAKWNPAGSTSNEKVTLILNYNYVNASLQTEKVTKGATYNLPTPTHPDGYTFDGWYTLAVGGTKWTNTTAINQDTTLYAHWSEKQSGNDDPPSSNISSVLSKYADTSNWNFADTVTISDSTGSSNDYYEYLGDLVLNRYEGTDGNTYSDYYDMSDYDVWYVYGDNGDGTHTKYDDTTDDFSEYYSYTAIIDLSTISSYTFTQTNGYYSAQKPGDAGKAILGDYGDDYAWTSFSIYISNGNITKLVGVMKDGTTYTHVFSKFGTVSFTLPDANSGNQSDYTITIDSSKSTIVEVGATVDYTQYFTITDKDGASIAVTESMLDLSSVDTSKTGTFTITITYEDASKTLTFTVVAAGTDITTTPAELTAVFANYSDITTWNFAVSITGDELEDYYEYLGYSVLNRYTYDGTQYTDYLGYESNTYYFFYDNGDGTYTKFAEGTDDYEECYYYLYLVELRNISNYTFIASGDGYVAVAPSEAGNYVLGEFQSAWTSFTVYIANGKITKIVGVMSDGYTMTVTFSKQGAVSFTLPNATEGGNEDDDPTPVTPTGTMPNQVYNESTFDNSNLQQKTEQCEDSIGLPSTGTYHALVIPVQFQGDTITQAQLNKLNLAFNGTSAETGWESVASYYRKSSYGQLNITFDIMDVYAAQYNSSHYEKTTQTVTINGQKWTKDGSILLLEEVLAYYESILDLTNYNANANDGDDCIDAVYLIYSAPVDYSNDSFYWAYVNWYLDDTQYDGLYPYYYLFAGFDFMDEDLDKKPGMIVNAETYIHETGHLLGLDDYYDYDTRSGSNRGLGGADMMDYNVGDHGVYSKIMLGWLTPEIVTSTQTITIKSSQSNEGNRVILIPLNWNNSYFCEYLLIDLYTATGLNAMGASQEDTLLYGGASYGVRIYHVSSSAENPFSNDRGTLTDYDNSSTKFSLIKLVEADGETSKTSKEQGVWASASDLWQAGSTLSGKFPQYTRNDGKLLNFDISISSVSAEEATITITYKTTQAA